MIPPSPVFADASVDRDFRKNGYVVLPVLNASQIRSLLNLWDQLDAEAPAEDFYVTAFNPDPKFRDRAEQGVLAALTPWINSVLPGYWPAFGAFVVKRGGAASKAVPMHQDYSMVDQTVDTAVHLWCPLVDVEERNGCLSFVGGSHAFCNHISGIPANPSPWHPVSERLYKDCSTPVPLKAGTAVFFNQRTLHWSPGNQVAEPRVTVTSMCLPAHTNLRLHLWDPASPDRFDIVEVDGRPDFPLGAAMPHLAPYPANWRSIGSMDYTFQPFTPEQIEPLAVRRPAPAKVARRSGFFSWLHS